MSKHSIDKKTQEAYIQELVEFLKQPSIAALNKGMKEMADKVEEKLKSIGAKTQQLTIDGSYPYIIATLGEGEKTLLIYDHYDVQPEDPIELWDTPPFSPTIKNGKIYARGVADNKGNLLYRIQAIRTYIQQHGSLPIKIIWLIEGEEEIGSPHLEAFSEKYGHLWKDADICIWETGGVDEKDRPAMTIGMKGVLYVELISTLGQRDLHSGYASMVDSAVWRLLYALVSLRDKNGRITLDGFEKTITFPTAKEWELMENLDFDKEKTLQSLGRKNFLNNETDKKKVLFRHFFNGTCNICGIWGGFTKPKGIKTIIPNKASAKIDFRLVKDQDPDEILRLLREHLNKRGFKDIKIDKLVSEPVAKTDINHPLLQKIIKTISNSYGTEMQIKITSGGSGPMYFVADKYNIPVFHQGAGYPDAKEHAPNENIRIKDYIKAIEIFMDIIDSINI